MADTDAVLDVRLPPGPPAAALLLDARTVELQASAAGKSIRVLWQQCRGYVPVYGWLYALQETQLSPVVAMACKVLTEAPKHA